MASSITVPNREQIANYAPALADAVVTLATQAKADVNGLLGSGGSSDLEARFATTANLNLATTALTAIDGVTPVAGDVALVKNQSTGSQNGLYTVSAGAWTRVKDTGGADVLTSGMLVNVSEGTLGADTVWMLTTNAPITVGTTSLTFAQRGATVSASAAQALGTAAAGTATTVSASDHVHALPSATLGHHQARFVVTGNVTDLTQFVGVTGGSAQDGINGATNDRVLLVGQTTKSQNGIYVIGTIAANKAPLTRPIDWTAANVLPTGAVVEVSEGTLFANTSWKVTTTGAVTVDTTNVDLYPRIVVQTLALVAGSTTITNVPIFSATKTQFTVARVTPNTSTLTTGGYHPAAAATPGIVGTASVAIQAEVAAGTLNNADISTVIIGIHNQC